MPDHKDPYISGERLEAAANDGWRFRLPLTVRFSDLDAFGHVNNAVYLTYCELGRIAYLNMAGSVDSLFKITFIMARAELDFRRPVLLGQPLEVQVRGTRIGNKSFTLEYRLLVRHEDTPQLAAEGRSVIACYDYALGQSVPVPPTLAAAFEAFEGRTLRSDGK